MVLKGYFCAGLNLYANDSCLPMWVWILFIAFVILCLVVDLFLLNKEDHVIMTKEAGRWTALWVSVALGFSGVIWWLFSNGLTANPLELSPTDAVLDYITGYLVELSLSVDNLFVIAVIFSAFKIPPIYQHRVLFWGILGAVIFRALMIVFGVTLINQFHWVIYIFGAFLLYTAFTMLKDEDQVNPKESWAYKQISRFLPITDQIHGRDFFVIEKGKKYATPLFVTLIIIELTDIMFALDSIPAILAITQDEFIVFSSNILAVLGLRSMFFLVANIIEKFRYINYSLAAILGFVGLKMIFEDWIEIESWISLVVIALALGAGILFSMLAAKKEEKNAENQDKKDKPI